MQFTASAAVVRRLGDQLIRRPRAAFFELVKNGYDADATRVEIRISHRDEGRIEIEDDGSGMSETDIREKWCRLASENKIAAPYTERFRRRRLGAKGIGRFSVAKLGDRLKLTTRARDSREQTTVHLDFAQCTDERDLGDVTLGHQTGKPRKTLQHGTIIQIEGLRHGWNRRDLRGLRDDFEERNITINGNHPAYRMAYQLDLGAGAEGVPEERKELPAVRTHCAKCACLAWGRFHYQQNEDFGDFESRYSELLARFCEAGPAVSAPPEEPGAFT